MTVEEKINNFLKFWNNDVVDPTHYPIIFQHQLKIWKYYTNN